MAKLSRIDNHDKILSEKRKSRYKLMFSNLVRLVEFFLLCYLVYKAN